MYPPPMPPPPPPRWRPNENAFAWAFGMAALWRPATVAIHVAMLGVPTPDYEGGRMIGTFLLPIAAAGLLTGAIARGSRTEWPWWRYLIIALAIAVWLSVLLTLVRLTGNR